jgi:hypothetical protein
MGRMTGWRDRIDRTTNWAITVVAGMLSLSLSTPTAHHGVLVFAMVLVFLLLSIEARRYRFFDVYRTRVRRLERGYYAQFLAPRHDVDPDWALRLAEDLRTPRFLMSLPAAMPRLPTRFAAVILCFAPLFLQRSWRHAEVLLIGAILAPGQRTVTSILRITGLCRERRFVNYHRVLNRAAWSGRAAARVLLGLLLETFVPGGPVVLGIDDTIERRRGKRIGAKGIYRDPVRSSKSFFAKATGLRWLSLMLLVPIPWAGRVWALPFLTALAPRSATAASAAGGTRS